MEKNHHAPPVRVRVELGPALVNGSSETPLKVMVLLPQHIHHEGKVKDVCNWLRKQFLTSSKIKKRQLRLWVDGYLLPTEESAEIIRDGDHLYLTLAEDDGRKGEAVEAKKHEGHSHHREVLEGDEQAGQDKVKRKKRKREVKELEVVHASEERKKKKKKEKKEKQQKKDEEEQEASMGKTSQVQPLAPPSPLSETSKIESDIISSAAHPEGLDHLPNMGKHLRFSDHGDAEEVPVQTQPLPALHLYGRMHPDRLRCFQNREAASQGLGQPQPQSRHSLDDLHNRPALRVSFLPRCLLVPSATKDRQSVRRRTWSNPPIIPKEQDQEGEKEKGQQDEMVEEEENKVVDSGSDRDGDEEVKGEEGGMGASEEEEDEVEGNVVDQEEEDIVGMAPLNGHVRGKDYEVVAVAGDPASSPLTRESPEDTAESESHYPLLESEPVVGDVLAYRLLELSMEDWTPALSCYKRARVVKACNDGMLTVELEDGTHQEMEWSSMQQVRLISRSEAAPLEGQGLLGTICGLEDLLEEKRRQLRLQQSCDEEEVMMSPAGGSSVGSLDKRQRRRRRRKSRQIE